MVKAATKRTTREPAKAKEPGGKSQPVAKSPPVAKSQPVVRSQPVARVKRVAARAMVSAKGEAVHGHDVNLGFLADFIGFHLRLAQDASYRAFARHRDKDLIKPGRFPALAIIYLNPGISQSALGRAIARDKSTVSPLIKDLQKNGFISRKPSAHDRRSVTLALTKKGERTLDRLHTRARIHEAEIDKLVGASKGRLMSMLGKITTGIAG